LSIRRTSDIPLSNFNQSRSNNLFRRQLKYIFLASLFNLEATVSTCTNYLCIVSFFVLTATKKNELLGLQNCKRRKFDSVKLNSES
jgi:hypothetical protein